MASSTTVNLNDSDEALLLKITNEYNALVPNNPNPLSPAQMMRETIRNWLRSNSDRYSEVTRQQVRETYRNATPEVQAQVNALLGLT